MFNSGQTQNQKKNNYVHTHKNEQRGEVAFASAVCLPDNNQTDSINAAHRAINRFLYRLYHFHEEKGKLGVIQTKQGIASVWEDTCRQLGSIIGLLFEKQSNRTQTPTSEFLCAGMSGNRRCFTARYMFERGLKDIATGNNEN